MEMQKVQTPLLEKVLHPVQLPARYSEAIESANVCTGLPLLPEALAVIPTAQHE